MTDAELQHAIAGAIKEIDAFLTKSPTEMMQIVDPEYRALEALGLGSFLTRATPKIKAAIKSGDSLSGVTSMETLFACAFFLGAYAGCVEGDFRAAMRRAFIHVMDTVIADVSTINDLRKSGVQPVPGPTTVQ